MGLDGSATNPNEMVAGCLADKMWAIINGDDVPIWPNTLLVEMAACCTKGEDKMDCIQDLQKPYFLIQRLGQKNASKRAGPEDDAIAAAYFIKAVNKRIEANRLVE